MTLTHISLFSGIGGDTLAAEWARFKTVLFVENDPFCQRVLAKHWPDVPLIGDIHDVTKETLADASLSLRQTHEVQTGGKTTDVCLGESGRSGNPDSPITLVTGGVPCQPASVAGQQRGKADDRWLWQEALRVVQEVRPRWVVFENPTGIFGLVEYDSPLEMDDQTYSEADIRDMGNAAYRTTHRVGRGLLDEIVVSLQGQGYEVWPDVHPACAVDAPHRRDRIFIVAHARCLSDDWRGSERDRQERTRARNRPPRSGEYTGALADASINIRGTPEHDRAESPDRCSQDVADAAVVGCKDSGRMLPGIHRSPQGDIEDKGIGNGGGRPGGQWEFEPDVGRVAHGVPARVDRLRSLGNAIVPQQIYPILKGIADIERLRASQRLTHLAVPVEGVK